MFPFSRGLAEGRHLALGRGADPFRAERERTRALRALKGELVRLGRSGSRREFELARRFFAEIPELRSA